MLKNKLQTLTEAEKKVKIVQEIITSELSGNEGFGMFTEFKLTILCTVKIFQKYFRNINWMI